MASYKNKVKHFERVTLEMREISPGKAYPWTTFWQS